MRESHLKSLSQIAFFRETSSCQLRGNKIKHFMCIITELNIKQKLGDTKQLSNTWQPRNLTPYGKTEVIESHLLLKLTHFLLCLPSPDINCLDYLDSIDNQFLLTGK